MKLSEMKQVLASGQIQLTKSLGQNFLHDQNQLRRIADAAELTKTDKVLEIGPGLGPLTELLLERAGEVLAIEKDRRLAEFLRQRFGAATNREHPHTTPTRRDIGLLTPHPGPVASQARHKMVSPKETRASRAVVPVEGRGWPNAAAANLTLIEDDALDYVKHKPRDWAGWKLVANLPYSVASPILVELAQVRGCPERMVVTLQLEVARRLVARAGEADYGVLSLLVQLNYEPRGHFKIPADCFFPAPEVDSACVSLIRREQPLLPAERHADFARLVKLGFSQRRKMMMKLLKQDWPAEKLAAAFERLGLSPQIRAEKVGLEQFVGLTEILA